MLSQSKPELYKLRDLQQDLIPGYYYASQLTKAPPPSEKEYFFIEKILDEKRVRGKKFYLVKYLFYGDKFNQIMILYELYNASIICKAIKKICKVNCKH